MAFKVVIADGPAAGWSYITAVAPDPVIAIAPTPREDETSPLRWTRVLIEDGAEPWPNQRSYRRGVLPDSVTARAFVDDDGDFEVPYNVVG